ncbi:TPA: ABC transporter ATP-binding protein [Candidatus Bathyarchaeota archaeon]|nr:ABC transporter ATP-binding protein [Candidatus Bathyarchaeota archaeon]
MASVIEIKNLTKKYGDLLAVDHVNYTIEEGEIFGLLGHNGAGKTTTILMLLGLIPPTEGTAIVNGVDVIKEPLQSRRHVGLLPENAGFYENLTARQNLLFYAELADVPDKEASERVEKLIDQVGLDDKRGVKVSAYSRGMRQRLGIAQSLVRDPKVLILDEPTQGIDPEGTQDIRKLIRTLSKDRGMTIIFTTHVLYEVNKLCDRVAIMKNGAIAGIGTIPELRKQVNADEGEDFEQIFLRYQGVV